MITYMKEIYSRLSGDLSKMGLQNISIKPNIRRLYTLSTGNSKGKLKQKEYLVIYIFSRLICRNI